MRLEKIEEIIEMPEGCSAVMQDGILSIKMKDKETNKKLLDPFVKISVESNKIKVLVSNATKRQKKMIGTFKAHIRNMIVGVEEGHKYTLKVCSGHFPMNITLNKTQIEIKNFLGEKVPRILDIKEGVSIKMEGDIIHIESVDKELAGQVAASIEQLTRITNRDRRIFQDGIYITSKSGKELK